MRTASDLARRRLAWLVLVPGTIGALGQLVLVRPAASVAYLIVAAVAVAMSVTGAVLYQGMRRRIWVVIAAGQAASLSGEVMWTMYEDVLHIAPFPSPADLGYLAYYPLVAVGLVWLVRSRQRGRERAALLDAAVITTGVTVVAVVFVVLPAAQSQGSVFTALVAAAYPAGDILLFAVLVRLLTTGASRNLAFWSLVAGLVAMLASDTQFVLSVIADTQYPAWCDVGWLMALLLVGFASVHPSVDRLADPAPEHATRITPLRLAALGLALALAPLAYAAQRFTGSDDGNVILLAGSLASIGLVLARMWDLLADQQRKADQLAALARLDSLTGVANRRTWDEELTRACDAARASGHPLTVAVLALDRFQDFNEAHGHLAGDLVLRQTARAWAERVGAHGFLARFGGGVFTVLFPNAHIGEAQPLLDEMRTSVARGQTCSVGLAVLDDEDGPDDLLARADQALLYARQRGRNRMSVHDGVAVRESLWSTPNRLRTSLQTVYQPIVELEHGTTYAYEALSRFEGHSDPREVFADATSPGTGAALEALALSHAVAAWSRSEALALNVGFSTLLGDLARHALPEDLNGIILEVSASDFEDDYPDLVPVLTSLRARGARVAVEHISGDVRAVERIRRLRPDILKCSPELIRDMGAHKAKLALLRRLVSYANEFGCLVCAHGVTTEDESRTLRELGVHLGQGVLFGRPVPLADPAEKPATVGATKPD